MAARARSTGLVLLVMVAVLAAVVLVSRTVHASAAAPTVHTSAAAPKAHTVEYRVTGTAGMRFFTDYTAEGGEVIHLNMVRFPWTKDLQAVKAGTTVGLLAQVVTLGGRDPFRTIICSLAVDGKVVATARAGGGSGPVCRLKTRL